MALTIASREVDGVTVLDLSGRITLGEGSVQLREAVRDLISKGSHNILLNMGDVNYIDSSGLGELVSAFTTAKNQGASVKLLEPDQKGQGRSPAHQALHRLRRLRGRGQRHRILQVTRELHSALKKAIPSGWPFLYGGRGGKSALYQGTTSAVADAANRKQEPRALAPAMFVARSSPVPIGKEQRPSGL